MFHAPEVLAPACDYTGKDVKKICEFLKTVFDFMFFLDTYCRRRQGSTELSVRILCVKNEIKPRIVLFFYNIFPGCRLRIAVLPQ